MFLWLRWGKLLKLAASVIFPTSIWFCLKFVKGSRCARPATLLKKRLWHRCFPVNFAKFLRTPFLQNTSGRLLLKAIFFLWTELLENLLLAKYLISVTLTLHFVGWSLDISWNHENENCGTSKKSKPCFRFLYPK